MERKYENFKLLRINRYKNEKEKTKHYLKLQEENMPKFKEIIKEDYEDKIHVLWSWQIFLFVLSIITILYTGTQIGNFINFIIPLGISLIFFIGSRMCREFLIQRIREYSFLESIIDSIIEENKKQFS